MTYYLKYELDVQRLIMAVVNDARAIIPELGPNADGNDVYAYSQALIALMVPGVILYRVETLNGNLGAVVAINTNSGAVGTVFLQPRPAAVPFLSEISEVITTFISENQFFQDVLY